MIRKARQEDLQAVAVLYERAHTAEEQGLTVTGWKRGVYPTARTAEAALDRDDLFVMTGADGAILGAAILNHAQVDVYAGAPWTEDVPDAQVFVMHTLVMDPDCRGRGLGRAFARFYEDMGRSLGCSWLRIDTNARNTNARAFYNTLGYRQVAVRPCVFNGLADVALVLLEKRL